MQLILPMDMELNIGSNMIINHQRPYPTCASAITMMESTISHHDPTEIASTIRATTGTMSDSRRSSAILDYRSSVTAPASFVSHTREAGDDPSVATLSGYIDHVHAPLSLGQASSTAFSAPAYYTTQTSPSIIIQPQGMQSDSLLYSQASQVISSAPSHPPLGSYPVPSSMSVIPMSKSPIADTTLSPPLPASQPPASYVTRDEVGGEHSGGGVGPDTVSPDHQQPLRYNIVLNAVTAVSQKNEEAPITYLNRGQLYGITLESTEKRDEMIRSTFILTFHEASHRKAALNYWKFWIGQQKDPQQARAIDLDANQSIGISNIKYPRFNCITFEWNGLQGASIFVRFHCLSTDFSRIKGVKGIPLRAHVDSQAVSASLEGVNAHKSVTDMESSYCKIKLFRDKGAERKNKDDAKQAGRQFERLLHNTEGDTGASSSWTLYSQPQPYSMFSLVPTSPIPEHEGLDNVLASERLASQDTYPTSTDRTPMMHQAGVSKPIPTLAVPLYDAPASVTDHARLLAHASGVVPPLCTNPVTTSLVSHVNPTPYLRAHYQDGGLRRKRSCASEDDANGEMRQFKRRCEPALSLFVDTSSSGTLSSREPTTQTTLSPTDPRSRLKRMDLDELTVQDLTVKLCSVLSLHHTQVSEVVWRKVKATRRQDDSLVHIDDEMVARQLPENSVMHVEWDIKANGTVRLIIQY